MSNRGPREHSRVRSGTISADGSDVWATIPPPQGRDLYRGIACTICGRSINWYQDFTLHHLHGQHGGPLQPLAPAHRRCNQRAAAAKANEVRRQRYGPTLSRPRRVWPGAIRLDE